VPLAATARTIAAVCISFETIDFALMCTPIRASAVSMPVD